MLHASISGPARWPSKVWPRGAILVSTSNASSRHSCTPLSPRINDPRSVFSTWAPWPLFPDERRADGGRFITRNKRLAPPTVRRRGNGNVGTRCSHSLTLEKFLPGKFRFHFSCLYYTWGDSTVLCYVCSSVAVFDNIFHQILQIAVKWYLWKWHRDRLVNRYSKWLRNTWHSFTFYLPIQYL